jgi:hypothetical protein
LRGIAGLGAISGFAAVSLRHPYSLHTLPIRECDEVPNRSILGHESLLDDGQTDGITLVYELAAKRLREG